MAVARAVSHGREPVCRCPVTHDHDRAEEGPSSVEYLYSKDSVPSAVSGRSVTART